MATQQTLDFSASLYPAAPGFKRGSVDTSAESARRMARRAVLLRHRCAEILRQHPEGLTSDEVAAALGQTVLAIRPRVSEMHTTEIVVDTGLRRPNISGHPAAVWRLKG